MKRKSIKKAGVAVLSMALLLSMGAMAAPVNAATGDAKVLQVYDLAETKIKDVTVYQVATQDAQTGAWKWEDGFVNNADFGTLKNASAVELNTLATQLKNMTKTNGVTPVTAHLGNMAGGMDYRLDISGKGYYLVLPTVEDNATVVQPALVQINADDDTYTVVKAKANPLPLNKYITATSAGETAKDDGKSKTSTGILGAIVSYSIESVLPEYDGIVAGKNIKPYILTDDPSDGISIDLNSIKVTVGGVDVTNDQKIAVASLGDGFTVTVDGTFIKPDTGANNEGKNIVVTFDATIDNDAVFGSDKVADADKHNDLTGNPNTVKLTWGNNFSTGNYAYPNNQTPPPGEPEIPDEPKVEKKDHVTTYIGKVELLKQGEQNGSMAPLANAKFKLEGTNFTAADFTSDRTGKIDFGYLPAGTYTLTETQAPAGFKTIGASYQFTVKTKEATSTDFTTYEVSQDDRVEGVAMSFVNNNAANANITVTDPPADTLPATGGIGTYVFTFGGAAIILLAGVLFVIYMKKRKAED